MYDAGHPRRPAPSPHNAATPDPPRGAGVRVRGRPRAAHAAAASGAPTAAPASTTTGDARHAPARGTRRTGGARRAAHAHRPPETLPPAVGG